MRFSFALGFVLLLGAPAPPGNHLADKLSNPNAIPLMVTGFVLTNFLRRFDAVSKLGPPP